jgi:outer membrane immunogenic protein
MKKLLLAGVAFAALAGSATAADLARPVYRRPVAVAPFSWTGFYAGANIGGAWENTETNYNYITFPAPNPPGFRDLFGPGGPLNVPGLSDVASAIAHGFLPVSLGNNQQGVFTGGAQLGYNFQLNQVVVGAEADIAWLSGGVRTTNFIAPPNGFITNVAQQNAGLRYLGTVRARVGWAVDRALFYATGGLAYGQVVASSNASNFDGARLDLFAGDGSGTRTGYAVGGGLEYALLSNVTIKAEYLYYNLGTATYTIGPANVFAAGEGIIATGSQKFDGSLVRFGINYKFGNYYAPVATK